MTDKEVDPEVKAKAVFAIQQLVETMTGQALSTDEATKLFEKTQEKVLDAMAQVKVEK